jgi:hypothetical protein
MQFKNDVSANALAEDTWPLLLDNFGEWVENSDKADPS